MNDQNVRHNIDRNHSDEWLPAAIPSVEGDIEWTGHDLDTADVVLRTGHTNQIEEKRKLHFQYAAYIPSLGLHAEYYFYGLLAWCRAQFAVEIDRGAAFLWSPVLLGIGCITYFQLPREPLVFAFPAFSLLLLACCWKTDRGRGLNKVLLSLFLVSTGVCAAQMRTAIIDTPVMTRTTVATITGRVSFAEHRANGRIRYTIDLTAVGSRFKVQGANTRPNIIRLTARQGGPDVRVGDFISGRARLGPMLGPVLPGSYDFSFNTWFLGIGGSGFFLGPPTRENRPATTTLDAGLLISQARSNISRIIRQALPGKSGGLAAALIVGDRSGIDEDTAEDLRRSGLAHILAISGLHMALVSLTVVIVLRAIFAFMPSVSFRHPTRKWASGVALLAATVYLIMSGANVSTQRAYIMVAIMLLAVILDRRALTMRNVALAAILVLFIAPEAVLSPGFQMSFAAVAALVGTYELVSNWQQSRIHVFRPGVLGIISRFLRRDIGGLALTSLVAGIATGLYAAFHFYRVAPMGLVANLLAMPPVTFIVMPSALVSAVLMPFGLEVYPLQLMALSLEWVVAIAHKVSGVGPTGNTGLISPLALLLGTGALLVATLMRSKLKLLAIPFLGFAVMAVQQQIQPDIIVLENGNQIGLLDGDGKMQLLRPNAEKFSTKIWSQAYMAEIAKPQGNGRRRAIGDLFTCDRFGCSATYKGQIIVHINNTGRLDEDCQLADIIVIPYHTPDACSFMSENERPIVLDAAELGRYGAHTIKFTEASVENGQHFDRGTEQIISTHLEVTKAIPNHIRPWTRHRARRPLQGD